MLFPLFSVFSSYAKPDINFPEINENADIALSREIIEKTVENMENSIKNMLFAKYGVKKDDMKIEILISDEDIFAVEITEIDVYLYKQKDFYKSNDIKNYLEQSFYCKINVEKKTG